MRAKLIPLYLPPDLYSRLERAARAEDREPVQQAAWLLRRALDTPSALPPSGMAPTQDSSDAHQ
jgi:hypothetical protein